MHLSVADIIRAQEFAHAGHDLIRQVRKYTGGHYWVHTDAVANAWHDFPSSYSYIPIGILGEIVCHLHDLDEDVNIYPYNLQGIRERFGPDVAYCVEELTHKYTPQKYPSLNRAERKVLEAWRLGNALGITQDVKIFDLMDNTPSIIKYDPGFAKIYLKEKEFILSLLTRATPELLAKAKRQLTKEKKKLSMK